jgi:hypothetical protein
MTFLSSIWFCSSLWLGSWSNGVSQACICIYNVCICPSAMILWRCMSDMSVCFVEWLICTPSALQWYLSIMHITPIISNCHQVWIFLPRHTFQRDYVHGCLDHTADVKQRELLQNTNQAKQYLFSRLRCGPASTDYRCAPQQVCIATNVATKDALDSCCKVYLHALTEFTVHISSWRFICDCWCMDLLGLCPKALTLEESAGFCACICGCIMLYQCIITQDPAFHPRLVLEMIGMILDWGTIETLLTRL